jgi:hypothetical protein
MAQIVLDVNRFGGPLYVSNTSNSITALGGGLEYFRSGTNLEWQLDLRYRDHLAPERAPLTSMLFHHEMRHWKCRLYSFPALIAEHGFWQIFRAALGTFQRLWFLFHRVAALHAKFRIGRKVLAALRTLLKDHDLVPAAGTEFSFLGDILLAVRAAGSFWCRSLRGW